MALIGLKLNPFFIGVEYLTIFGSDIGLGLDILRLAGIINSFLPLVGFRMLSHLYFCFGYRLTINFMQGIIMIILILTNCVAP